MDRTLNEVFYLPRLIGTFPFRGDFTLSRNRIVYSIFLISISIVFTSLLLLSIPSKVIKNNINFEYLRSVKLIVICVNCTLSTLWLSIRRKTIYKIGRYVLNFPIEFKNSINPSRFNIFIWSHFCILLTLLCLLGKTYIYVFLSEMQIRTTSYIHLVFLILSYGFGLALQLSIIGQFSGWLKIIYKLCLSIKLAPENSQILLQYDRLSWLSHYVNKVYGLPFLMYVCSTLVFTISALHNFMLDRSVMQSQFYVIQSFWITSFFLPILDCIYSINQNVHEAKKVNDFLYKRLMNYKSNMLITNDLLEFHLTSCRKLVFTACGFFTVDNSLICSMFACATTYLVILLQITQPTNQKL